MIQFAFSSYISHHIQCSNDDRLSIRRAVSEITNTLRIDLEMVMFVKHICIVCSGLCVEFIKQDLWS